MSHVRKQIRARFVSELTGLPTTQSLVYGSKYFPHSDLSLPVLSIYPDESAEQIEQDADTKILRELRMVVAGIASATHDVEDTLDDIATEVEETLSFNLGGLAITNVLNEVRFLRNSLGKKEVAIIEMVFSVLYRTARTAPEVSV